MYKEIIKNLSLRFWFTLVFGVLGILTPFWELRKVIPQYSYYFIAGFFVGLGLGVIVTIVERSRYIHNYHQKDPRSPYTTTSLPDIVFAALLLLTIIINPKKEQGYATIISMALGTFLLFLSLVLFRIRNNKQIIIRN